MLRSGEEVSKDLRDTETAIAWPMLAGQDTGRDLHDPLGLCWTLRNIPHTRHYAFWIPWLYYWRWQRLPAKPISFVLPRSGRGARVVPYAGKIQCIAVFTANRRGGAVPCWSMPWSGPRKFVIIISVWELRVFWGLTLQDELAWIKQ